MLGTKIGVIILSGVRFGGLDNSRKIVNFTISS